MPASASSAFVAICDSEALLWDLARATRLKTKNGPEWGQGAANLLIEVYSRVGRDWGHPESKESDPAEQTSFQTSTEEAADPLNSFFGRRANCYASRCVRHRLSQCLPIDSDDGRTVPLSSIVPNACAALRALVQAYSSAVLRIADRVREDGQYAASRAMDHADPF